MFRATASISDRVCSAAAMVFSPGAFITTTPRRVAAATSMLSTPVPALPTTRRERAAASTSSVTLVSERTTSPTAPASASLSSGTERPILVSVFMPACRSISAQTGATGSEMRILSPLMRPAPRSSPGAAPRPLPECALPDGRCEMSIVSGCRTRWRSGSRALSGAPRSRRRPSCAGW